MNKASLHYIHSLSLKKNREKEGCYVIEGWKMLEEAMKTGKRFETFLFTSEAGAQKHTQSVFRRFKTNAEKVMEISAKELSQMTDTVTAQGVAAVLEKSTSLPLSSLLSGSQNMLFVFLDGISEPGNLGSIIRSCDWFGVNAIFLNSGCVELYNPKVVRSTVGSIFHLPIYEGAAFLDMFVQLRHNGFRVYGAELTESQDIRTVNWPKKIALVIGNETRGISPEISLHLDEHIVIPKFGSAESLNAGVACAVLLSHLRLREIL